MSMTYEDLCNWAHLNEYRIELACKKKKLTLILTTKNGIPLYSTTFNPSSPDAAAHRITKQLRGPE